MRGRKGGGNEGGGKWGGGGSGGVGGRKWKGRKWEGEGRGESAYVTVVGLVGFVVVISGE